MEVSRIKFWFLTLCDDALCLKETENFCTKQHYTKFKIELKQRKKSKIKIVSICIPTAPLPQSPSFRTFSSTKKFKSKEEIPINFYLNICT